MFTLIVLLVIICGVLGHVHDLSEIERITFDEFTQRYGIKYLQSERTSRKQLFEDERERVLKHNAANKGWKETLNRFSIMTKKEKKHLTHGRNKVPSGHSKLLRSHNPYERKHKNKDVPEWVDWTDKGIVTAVKDQGHCGSCYSFAALSTMESAVAKASGLLFDLSVEQTTQCTPNPSECGGTGGCAGGTSELVFDYVAKSSGLLEAYMWGYSSYYGNGSTCALPEGPAKASIDGFVKLPENELNPVLEAVAAEGPLAISVDASSWHAYHSGIYDGCNTAQPDIDHAVVLVGYGEENGQKFWKVRNSWSASWGEKGYIRLMRADDEETKCGTDTTPQDGTACKGDTEPKKVCGTCGILFDTSYVVGAKALN